MMFSQSFEGLDAPGTRQAIPTTQLKSSAGVGAVVALEQLAASEALELVAPVLLLVMVFILF